MAELLVGGHRGRRSVKGYCSGLDIRGGGQVDRFDGHRTAVHEVVGAADLHLAPLGIDLDVQVGPRQPGLRDTLVSPIAPLVLGSPLHPVGGGGVFVQHIRVVEDETTRRENEHNHHRGSPGCPKTRRPCPISFPRAANMQIRVRSTTT